MKKFWLIFLIVAVLLVAILATKFEGFEPTSRSWSPPTQAGEKAVVAARENCRAEYPVRQALYGDLHNHAGVSMDADALRTRTSSDDAYAFVRGQAIDGSTGDSGGATRKAKLGRPLDFTAVTDHAEWVAEVSICIPPGSTTYDSEGCKICRGEEEFFLASVLSLKGFRAKLVGLIGFSGRRSNVCGEDDGVCRAALKSVWHANPEAAERWYDGSDACEFTTFRGWEYSHSPYSTKVHRNTILRNEISPGLPVSSLGTPREMDLRHQLVDLYNDTQTGCEAIAIPHNPKLSNGQMFRVEYADRPMEDQSREAALRARLEPIDEMMQIKSERECRNGIYQVLRAPDELCNIKKTRVCLSIPETERSRWMFDRTSSSDDSGARMDLAHLVRG